MTTQELILHTVGKIDGKLDALGDTLVSHTTTDATNFEKIDKRLEGLEAAKWKLAGAMATSVFAAEFFWRLTA